MQTDDVHTQDLLGVLVEQHLGDALALQLGQRLGVRAEVTGALSKLHTRC